MIWGGEMFEKIGKIIKICEISEDGFLKLKSFPASHQKL
jgi:hypothetical protein